MYNDVLQNERKLRDNVEHNRIADSLFELRGFFLGGRHSNEAKRQPADRPGADQNNHRFGYVVNILQCSPPPIFVFLDIA
jgi:hypothetical protein